MCPGTTCKRDKENNFPFILKEKWFSIIGSVILLQDKMVLHSFANQTMLELKIEENIVFPENVLRPIKQSSNINQRI